MRVLVTGGAGFIGSHLVRFLLDKGEQVTVLDDFSDGLMKNLPSDNRLEVLKYDVTKPELSKVFEDHYYDTVVHLAGQTTVNLSMSSPSTDAAQNIIGSINVLEQSVKSGVKRVVFSSTAATYGDVSTSNLPINEFENKNPLSFYGLSKLTVESYLKLFNKLFGIDYVVLRFANVYGERQGYNGKGGVISIFIEDIINNRPITVFGDGSQKRDFIYVGDIVRGIYSAIYTDNPNREYNLSTQNEISINELIDTLKKLSNKKLEILHRDKRDGDIYESLLDNGKARYSLGWSPNTNIEEGLSKVYNYYNS